MKRRKTVHFVLSRDQLMPLYTNHQLEQLYNEGYQHGFEAGRADQLRSVFRHFNERLNELENIKRIGPVLANRIRDYLIEGLIE